MPGSRHPPVRTTSPARSETGTREPGRRSAGRPGPWASALAGVINVLDIPAVVLGGHLGQVADLLRPELGRHLRSRTLSARWVTPDIVAAEVDPAPGATGAAMLELSTVLAHPARWL